MDDKSYDNIVHMLQTAQKRSRKPKTPRERPSDWRRLLAESGEGYVGDERNVLIALSNAPELAGLTRFNQFGLNIEFTRSPPWREVSPGAVWEEIDDTHLTVWLQARDLKVRNRGAVADCVAVAAQEAAYHPVRDYLGLLKWDGEPRLKIWLLEYLNAVGDGSYLAAVGMRFLVSAVARVMAPGCQADHVLVPEGPQGIGKTRTARTLAVRDAWFAGDVPDLETKDAPMQLVGRWIVELAELKAIRNSQIERVKSFITQCTDTFRPPYGRRTAQFPRQCVFIATTNETEYLRDRTGNRRYWPVRCQRIDLDGLLRDRDQLWAEAVHEFQAGTQWHLTDAEAALANVQQAERVYVTELEQDVAAYLTRERQAGRAEITVREVLTYGLGLDPASQTYADSARKLGAAAAEALERAGWRKVRRIGGNRTVYRHAR